MKRTSFFLKFFILFVFLCISCTKLEEPLSPDDFHSIIKPPTLLSPTNDEVYPMGSEVSFSWGESPNIINYFLQIARDSCFSDLSIDTPLTTTICTLPYKRIGGGHFYWRVTGVALVHNEVCSTEVYFTSELQTYDWFPYEVGYYDTPGYARSVFISGSYAYVADDYAGLRIIDVSTPSAPTEVGSYDTPGYACDVYVSGSNAYVADCDSGLRVIDVSNPSDPQEVGFNYYGEITSVEVLGSYAYLTHDYIELLIYNISDPSNPTQVGLYNKGSGYSRACDVTISGNYAYVAALGLLIIDVSDPSMPFEVGFYGPTYPPYLGIYDVIVIDNYAYLACDDVRIIDISDPSNPTFIGVYYILGNDARGVAISGSYAFVADAGKGLQVVDIANPCNPFEVGNCDTPGAAAGIYVSGSYAYVADGDAGLRIIKISP